MTLTTSSPSLSTSTSANITNSHDPSSPDLVFLNLSRLLTRLEYNLLSSSADLKQLKRSEFQRLRVGGNIEYARSLLISLERNLPQVKPIDRRHEIQMELPKKRQVFNAVREKLADISAEAELKERMAAGKGSGDGSGSGDAGDYVSSEEDEGDEDLLDTPEETESGGSEADLGGVRSGGGDGAPVPSTTTTTATTTTATPLPTTTTTHTPPTPAPETTTTTTSTLRNRHRATPSSTQPQPQPTQPTPPTNTTTNDQTLTTHRNEQESLTTSLITLASHLKTSTQTFHSTLESEKSVLDRAVDGIDRTTSSMASAEKRMGMLRRMTEGRGLWGRLMLYAVIFGLWVVALGVVFLGPKIR